MIYTDILLIAFICVFIIDFSGVIESLEAALKKWVGNPFVHIPKPFSCSLCSTWWAGLIYLLIVGSFTIPNIAYVGLVAAFTPVFLRTLYFIRDFFDSVLCGLEDYFNLK